MKPQPAAFPYPKTEEEIPREILRTRIGFHFRRLVYQCPDSLWQTHLAAWRKHQGENPGCPEPFPFRHIVFNALPQPYAQPDQ